MKLAAKLLNDMASLGESEVVGFEVQMQNGQKVILTGPDSPGADIDLGEPANGKDFEPAEFKAALEKNGITGIEKVKSGTAGGDDEGEKEPTAQEIVEEAVRETEEPEEDKGFFGAIDDAVRDPRDNG